MIDENELMGIDLSEPSAPMTADDLYRELKVGVQCDNVDWLLEAVVEFAANGDSKFLQNQIVKHVPGWRVP